MSNEVTRLLEGAAKTMASVRYCWLVTTVDGAVHGRPMGRILPEAEEEMLTVRFLADDRSRKVLEIRQAAAVTAIFENQAEDGYVTVTGRASLQDDPAVVQRHWKPDYDSYFASEADRAHALFVDVAIERLELWIRGVTPEPFGVKPTVLEREANGWRLV